MTAVFLVAILSFSLNLPLGRWRRKYRKYTLPWWLLIHASIPLLIPARLYLNPPLYWIPFFIFMAVAGQFVGARFRVQKKEEDGGE